MTSNGQSKDGMRAHKINLLRDQILENIYNLTLTPSTTGAEKEALKREYNQLSNELKSLKQAPSMDPLARLPPEVWTEIVQETAEENGVNLSPTDVLLLFTLVSREWSTKIMGTPVLWTNIVVGRGDADAQAKLASALHFAGHLKFGITIELPPCQWEENLSLLRGHTARLKKITFRFSRGGYFHDETTRDKWIDDLFVSLGHLPSLKVLHGPNQSQLQNWNDIFKKCPDLTYIYGTVLPLEVLQTPNLIRPIRACRVWAPWRDIIPCLDKLSYLEELEWIPEDGMDVDIRGKYGPLPALPALRHILSYNVQFPNMLASLRLTERLTWLGFTIQGNWQYHYDFLHLLGHLRHLRSLQLDFKYIEGNFSFPTTQLATTSVQYLRLCYLTNSISTPALERNAAFVNQESLFSIFPICFSGVRWLELVHTSLGPITAAYIRSATRLSSLTLYNVESPDYKYDTPIISLTLKVLRLIFFARSVTPNLVISCPAISKLSLKVFGPPQKWDDWPSALVQIRHNVTHLQTSIGTSHRRIAEFTALQRLRVYGSSGGDSRSEILVAFICEPTICPLLVELELDFIPEWDLLFLMLECRNYLPQSRHVSRIETLLLPLPPSPRLLISLIEILAGRFTVRPSNKDLSMSGFMEAYFDPSIPGCQLCLRSLTFCSAPLKQGPGPPVRFHHVELPNKPPTISTETWNWLEGRENRLVEWERSKVGWVSYHLHRVQRCKMMEMAQQPFIITAHKFAAPPSAY